MVFGWYTGQRVSLFIVAGLNLTIRPETEFDYSAVHDVELRAFRREGEAMLIAALRCSDVYIPDLSFVAEIESGIVIGHILLTKVTLDHQDTGLLGLGPVAVAPEWQRRGVGSGMIAHAISTAQALGYAAIVLLGDPGFYSRFGFAPGSLLGLRSTYAVRDEEFMALPLTADSLVGRAGTIYYDAAFDQVT